jgi:hypothetical protein
LDIDKNDNAIRIAEKFLSCTRTLYC